MVFLYTLAPLVQILTAVHAVKTGRAGSWLWIILVFPLVGSVVYFIVEVVPDNRSHLSFGNIVDAILNTIQPERELKILQEQVELSNTVENKIALASYYVRAKQPEKAVEIYKSCLNGSFQKDAGLHFELSFAQYQAKMYDDAIATLAKLGRENPGYEPFKRELTYAVILEEKGQLLDARSIYEAIIEKFGGEEAHCRYALLLEKLGEPESAKTIFEEIIKRTKRLPSHQKRFQREWINEAKKGVARLSNKKG